MMHLSQLAPPTLQSTHYTALASSEVLGKLIFTSIVGYITDSIGYTGMYYLLLLAVMSVVLMTSTAPVYIRGLGVRVENGSKR